MTRDFTLTSMSTESTQAPADSTQEEVRYRCTQCGVVSNSDASFCIGCGKRLDDADHKNFLTSAQYAAAPKDKQYVYPRIPPLSPHICWTSALVAGLAQIIFGQYAKGWTLLVVSLILLTLTGGASFLPVAAIAVFDAYRVGRALRDSRPVKKWQCFP
jgi:hypothetical protein